MNLLKDTRKTKNVFNILILISAVAFVFTLFYSYISISSEQKYYEDLFLELRENALNYNQIVDQNKIDMDLAEKPIFETSLEAILTAYDAYNNFESCTINGKGYSVTEAPVIGKYYVEMEQTSAKWSDGLIFNEVRCYQTQGNKTFFDKTDGTASYSFNGERYNMKTSNVSFVNNTIIPNYDGCSYQKNPEYVQCRPLCYDITEETIKQIHYFNINYNKNGEIVNYEVSFNINQAGVQSYAEVIAKAGDLAKVPEFTNVAISMIIDSEGLIEVFKVTETYTVTKNFGFNVSTSLTNDLLYKITNINMLPTIERPNGV